MWGFGVLTAWHLLGFGQENYLWTEALISGFRKELASYSYVENLDEYYAAAMEQSQIKLSNGRNPDEEVGREYLQECKSLSYQVLSKLPAKHVDELQELVFFYKPKERRGYAYGKQIFMRCKNMSDESFAGVLIHELGHIVDTEMLRGHSGFSRSAFVDGNVPIFVNDDSVQFYEISWQDSETALDDTQNLDFVSEYARTNAFEDFAETYVYYVLHGDDFRELARYNSALKSKYLFMKGRVFEGREFAGTVSNLDYFKRPYDITAEHFDLASFLQ